MEINDGFNPIHWTLTRTTTDTGRMVGEKSLFIDSLWPPPRRKDEADDPLD
jgi:hypothetical protein